MSDERRDVEQPGAAVTFGEPRKSSADVFKVAQREAQRAMTPRERILLALRLGRRGAALAALGRNK